MTLPAIDAQSLPRVFSRNRRGGAAALAQPLQTPSNHLSECMFCIYAPNRHQTAFDHKFVKRYRKWKMSALSPRRFGQTKEKGAPRPSPSQTHELKQKLRNGSNIQISDQNYILLGEVATFEQVVPCLVKCPPFEKVNFARQS